MNIKALFKKKKCLLTIENKNIEIELDELYNRIINYYKKEQEKINNELNKEQTKDVKNNNITVDYTNNYNFDQFIPEDSDYKLYGSKDKKDINIKLSNKLKLLFYNYNKIIDFIENDKDSLNELDSVLLCKNWINLLKLFYTNKNIYINCKCKF